MTPLSDSRSSPSRRLGLAVTLWLLAISVATAATRPAARGEHGMVVGPERHAVEAGRDVLRGGGNAVDAAVATALALAVTYPQAGNLGGGGFLLYRAPDGTAHALDFRETAPAALTAAHFLGDDGRPVAGRSLDGGLAVGVPGSVAGLAEAHRRFGRLPWRRLVRPAVRLARRGFPLSDRHARDFEAHGERLARDPAARGVFRPGGRFPAAGERLRQPDLATTLRRIGSRGPRAFYEGRIADRIAAAVRDAGGVMTAADLAAYRPVWRPPIEGRYRGHRVVSFPPPSSGGVALLQILGMLEARDLGGAGYASSLTVHWIAEAERRAYADRSRWLGDPDFYDAPLARLLSPAYLTSRAASIHDERATPSAELEPGDPRAGDPAATEGSTQTLHLSVADDAGGAVALTTTLNAWFGVGIVAGDSGVLLNNEMDDFALAPGVPNAYGLLGGEANAVRGGKRPLSSMTPTIVDAPDGGRRPLLVLGSPGGSRIITSVLQVLINVIDHDMPLQEAVNAPRFHHQWYPDELRHEPRAWPGEVREALAARGHRLERSEKPLGNVNAIGLDASGAWLGAADPRREGAAAGY